MPEVMKMERRFRLKSVWVPDDRVVEEKEEYFHDAEFTLGCYMFLHSAIQDFKMLADVGDKLEIQFRDHRFTLERIK